MNAIVRFTVTVFALTILTLSTPAAQAPVSGLALPCLAPVEGVTWVRWTEGTRSKLDEWCATVGRPVVFDASPQDGDIDRLLVVSWNVHVGGGRIEDLVRTLRARETDRRTGMVLLLQEAFRAGEDVPESFPKGISVPSAIRPKPRSLDVAGIARQLGMSLAYVPSMRNGSSTREDRGNAILSTEPLSDVRAIETPFGKQRRVAVAATVTPRGSTIPPVRLVSTHFDIGGRRTAQAEALAGRIQQLEDAPLIVGGDFNAMNGPRDASVLAVGRHVPMEDCGTGRTHRWPLRLDVIAFFVGRLDYMFSTLDSFGLTRQCRTLDDAYDSDHVPILLTVER